MSRTTSFVLGFGVVAGIAAAGSPPTLLFSPPELSMTVSQNPDGSWNFENIGHDFGQPVTNVQVIATGPIDIGTFSVAPGPFSSQMIRYDFSGTLDGNGDPLIQSLDSITNISPSGREVWIEGLEVAGDVGSIVGVNDLNILIVEGDLGAIILDQSDLDPEGFGVGGNIFNVRVEGDATGDIYAPGAQINSAAMLSQGAVNNFVVLGSMTGDLEAREELVNITIEGTFQGNIATNVRPAGDAGPTNESGIEDLAIGQPGDAGTVLQGNIDTNIIRGSVSIYGNVNGIIDISAGFDDTGDELVIGGLVNSPSAAPAISIFDIPAGNQIILRDNADSMSSPGLGLGAGDTIDVGGVTITSLDYELSDSLLGGGTLASVPWAIRDIASAPDSGSVQQGPASNPALQEVVTGYYGSVVLDAQLGTVFSVTRVSAIGMARGSTPEAVPDIDVEIVAGSNGKVVRYFPVNSSPGFEWGYEYTITPGPGMICQGSTNSVPPPPHVFTLEAFCQTDLSGDGTTDSTDLSILLAQWGASGGPADFDGSGVVDSGDLSILLAGWGECGAAESAVMAGPSGLGMQSTSGSLDAEEGFGMSNAVAAPSNPVLGHFGFSSVGDYMAWLSGLNQAQFDAHLAELISYVSTLSE